MVMTLRIEPLLRNKSLMISWLSLPNTRSRLFVGVHDTCVKCPARVVVCRSGSLRADFVALLGMADSSDTSNFFRACFQVSLNSMSSGSV